MTHINFYTARSQIIVLAGILIGGIIDEALHARSDQMGLRIWMWPELLHVLAIIIGGILLAISLERYVRPLSRTGALMTGFCGYAVLVMVLP